MAVLVTLFGVLLIAAALLDAFQTLFHPAGRGTMSDWTAKVVWRVFRKSSSRYPKLLTYAGPVSILVIIVAWAALTWFGFALIYLPHLHSGFAQAAGVPTPASGLPQAMTLSLGALITLSEGTYATIRWLQIVRALEAVIGFGLLTASVSWLLSIYPVLESRRAVAEQATLLHHAERRSLDVLRDAPQQAPDWIFKLGAEIAGLRNQMSQFPITYYFDIGEPETALAGTLPYLMELAQRSIQSGVPALRLSGTLLGGAVHNFLELLAEDFLNMEPSDKHAIMLAYADEQMSDLILSDRTIPYRQPNDQAAD
jgi:hypothetical protein